MKKFKTIVLGILFIILIIGITSVNATTNNIEIVDAKVKEQSSTITVSPLTISNNLIDSTITFNELNDYVTVELDLKNNELSKYKINSIVDNNTSDNIKVEYNFDENYISQGKTTKVTVKFVYNKQLLNESKIQLSDLTIKINFVREDGKKTEIIVNPKTGNNIITLILPLIICMFGLFLTLINKKSKKLKVGTLLLLLSILPIPFIVIAQKNFETSIKFTDINIIGKFETYDITINRNDGEPLITKKITYGEAIGELPLPTKMGYDFIKWVDNKENEVTSNTIVKGPFTIEAIFVARTDTPYKVIHKKQNLDLDNYYIADTEENMGTTDEKVTPPVKNYQGFTSPSTKTITINGDGSTEVIYEYHRKQYNLTINNPQYILEGNLSGTYSYDTSITLTAVNRESEGLDIKWNDDITTYQRTIKITENITLSPEYIKKDLTLTFNPNSGTIPNGEKWTGSGDTATKIVHVDEVYGELPIPTKDGYDFVGWISSDTTIPDEYQEVEYIEGTTTVEHANGQYINTGFTPNQDTRIIADFQYTTKKNEHGFYFTGTEDANNSKQRFRFGSTWANGGQWLVGYNSLNVSKGTSDTLRHILDFNKNIVSLDGNILHEFAYESFHGYDNMYIFSVNTNNVRSQGPQKLYSYKIYDNETLVRDFVPCYRKNDGEAGLYDRINGTFYVNQGSGEFLVGEDIYSGEIVNSETVVDKVENHIVYAKWVVHRNTNQTSGQLFSSVRDIYNPQNFVNTLIEPLKKKIAK